VVFNSFAFFLFFPLVTLLYFWLPHRWRWPLLLAASCAFYMFFIPKYILILAFTIVVDYLAGILIERAEGRTRRLWLVASIVANVGVLAFFKYFNFLNDNLAALARFIGWNYPIEYLAIILPIGLSFHTFQAMSYTIEVYKGRAPAERHFGIYALYVMFYPQLVAGPIERPQALLPQFRQVHTFDYRRVTSGLKLMAWGLFRKTVVADRLAWVVNVVYSEPAAYPGPVLAVATIFFAFQILNDFGGYSDIAIGSARVMGFELRRNFDAPYQSESTAEFWRRWHMSLSSWFRDYVFRPIKAALESRTSGETGASAHRFGHLRQGFGVQAPYAIGVMVTFLLSGLWHGANWTFVVWGGLNGVYLIVGGLTKPIRDALVEKTLRPNWPALVPAVRRLATFALITVAWIFFRARSLDDAGVILQGLSTGWVTLLTPGGAADMFRRVGLTVAAVGVAGAIAVEIVEALKHRVDFPRLINTQPWWARWGLYYAAMASLYFLSVNEGDFIYFQF
jgi:alginate O-acetyltransferase complex protein AlgI